MFYLVLTPTDAICVELLSLAKPTPLLLRVVDVCGEARRSSVYAAYAPYRGVYLPSQEISWSGLVFVGKIKENIILILKVV